MKRARVLELSGKHSGLISATYQLAVWGPYLPCKRGVELQ